MIDGCGKGLWQRLVLELLAVSFLVVFAQGQQPQDSAKTASELFYATGG